MVEPNDQRERYTVRLAKDAFTFSAAHFITYDGGVCEPLHGHNYRVAVELDGPLDENAYVVDFIAARDALARIIAELDHRVLLPTDHRRILVEVTPEQEVVAKFEDRRWVFPREDCKLLRIDNTTAEQLALWIGGRLMDALAAQGFRPEGCRVEVDECEGQIGICRF